MHQLSVSIQYLYQLGIKFNDHRKWKHSGDVHNININLMLMKVPLFCLLVLYRLTTSIMVPACNLSYDFRHATTYNLVRYNSIQLSEPRVQK